MNWAGYMFYAVIPGVFLVVAGGSLVIRMRRRWLRRSN